MKFSILNILFVFCILTANANVISAENITKQQTSQVYNYTGSYTGKASPKKMNGKDMGIASIIPCECAFNIDTSHVLSGALVVPVVKHSFTIATLDAITGVGTYPIFGQFIKKGHDNGDPLTGEIVITKLSDNMLEFKCTAYLNGEPSSESIFTFSGTR